jgi:hypothetical protein
MEFYKKTLYRKSILMTITSQSCRNLAICADANEFRRSSYCGTVVNTFIDQKNHRNLTIVLKGDRTLILPVDTSGLYTFLDKGDSLIKIKNSDSLLVKRINMVHSFKVYYGCEN